MINYTFKNGTKRSITAFWTLALSVVFAIKGQWYLHLISVAVGELVVITFSIANRR